MNFEKLTAPILSSAATFPQQENVGRSTDVLHYEHTAEALTCFTTNTRQKH